MARTRAIETRRDRSALARDAGWGSVSLISVVAGVLAAYGAVAILAALAGGILSALGVDTDFTNAEWRQIGTGGAIVLGVVLLAAWMFGGYVAGRMAGRAGAANGAAVFVLGVIVVAVVAAAVELTGGTEEILDRLRDLGVPTTADQWSDIGTFAGIGSLLAMVLGSIIGGVLGVRWHAKVLRLAADPAVGPAAVRTERYVPESTVDAVDTTETVDVRDVQEVHDVPRSEPVRVDHNDTDSTRVVTYADGSIGRDNRH